MFSFFLPGLKTLKHKKKNSLLKTTARQLTAIETFACIKCYLFKRIEKCISITVKKLKCINLVVRNFSKLS